MYFPYFVTYMLVGLAISLLVLFWALKNGQFREQQRARYLPLDGEALEVDSPPVSRFNRYEGLILLFLAGAGLLATLAVLVFSLAAAPGFP